MRRGDPVALTVLVVEPDAASCGFWDQFLRAQGYRIVCVHDGREAIRANHAFRPDLVLLRDALPDMPGCEASRRIRQHPWSRMTPLVMIRPANGQGRFGQTDTEGIDEVVDEAGTPAEKLERIQAWLAWKAQMDHEAESALLSLARYLESRHPGTQGHGERLSAYAARLGNSLGLADEQIQALTIGGVLHDVGKVRVPDAILLKAGPLTMRERAALREHPIAGERICAPLKAFQDALPIIRHHHERMDGSGYPDGLVNEAIPLNARILQTVDIYDALTTDRPYRKALPADQALAIMRREVARKWMDGQLVTQLARLIDGLRSDAQFVDFCWAFGAREGAAASSQVSAQRAADAADAEPMRLTDWLRLGEVQKVLPQTASRAS